MPMPFTRPIRRNYVLASQPAMRKGGAPGLVLPPSNGVAMPGGVGTVHTIKNPQHQVPVRARVAPAETPGHSNTQPRG